MNNKHKDSDVITDPKKLVAVELKNAGFDINKMDVPKRVYILADGIYDAMIAEDRGEYKYPLGGRLYVFKNERSVGFIKGNMCSPAIATQCEDLIAGGVTELIHIGFAGGLQSDIRVGDVVITDGAFNDTAVARLYGYDCEFIESDGSLTDDIQKLLEARNIEFKRGKHWTTDAGYMETYGQARGFARKGALCVEMEGVGLFTVAKYRNCRATAIYIVSDSLSDEWDIGWEENIVDQTTSSLVNFVVSTAEGER